MAPDRHSQGGALRIRIDWYLKLQGNSQDTSLDVLSCCRPAVAVSEKKQRFGGECPNQLRRMYTQGMLRGCPPAVPALQSQRSVLQLVDLVQEMCYAIAPFCSSSARSEDVVFNTFDEGAG